MKILNRSILTLTAITAFFSGRELFFSESQSTFIDKDLEQQDSFSFEKAKLSLAHQDSHLFDTPAQIPSPRTNYKVRFDIYKQTIVGNINTSQEDAQGVIRVGGDFDRGTFCFAIKDRVITDGVAIYPRERICYIIESVTSEGYVKWVKKKLSDIACVDLPQDNTVEIAKGGGGAAVTTAVSLVTTQENVPILNSREIAKTVLYLDFIGGKVQDPLWNGGKVMYVSPANYNLDQIKTVYSVVAERYAAFNINVTTDPQRYANAPVGNRMRIILTTTPVVAGYGGYSFIGSLRNAGRGIFSSSVPCFTFVQSVGNAKNAGEVTAHELGHTFGLNHDSTTILGSSKYYYGQGVWAPIMGCVYTRAVAQWSKGEYNQANNKEDDINIIASTPNTGFTSSTNDKDPIILGESLSVSDIICPDKSRYFSYESTTAGTLQLNVSVPFHGALNAAIELRDGSNTSVLNKVNTANNLSTQMNTLITPGKYIIRVYGEGEGYPKTTGYSSYGSIGSFVLTGTLK